MPIQQWSDQIVVVEIGDNPQFTDELDGLEEQLGLHMSLDVVVNMRGVSYVNSANIAKLLRLRKVVIAKKRRICLTGINEEVREVLLMVGLDQLFDVADDTASALALLQMTRKQHQES
jgi:anti-anti-sigma factor